MLFFSFFLSNYTCVYPKACMFCSRQTEQQRENRLFCCWNDRSRSCCCCYYNCPGGRSSSSSHEYLETPRQILAQPAGSSPPSSSFEGGRKKRAKMRLDLIPTSELLLPRNSGESPTPMAATETAAAPMRSAGIHRQHSISSYRFKVRKCYKASRSIII